MIFDIQRFADVEVGTEYADELDIDSDDSNSQVYGLAGNDIIQSYNASNTTLIGGSGNDFIYINGGTGTLSGGTGIDMFSLNYSASSTLSVVIEDIEPSIDRILINYSGNDGTSPNLSYSISGNDVIWTDSNGYLSVTIKGQRSLDEYYDQYGDEVYWEILEEVNEQRELNGLASLTLSKEITNSANVRANELIEYYSHTRPDGSECFTALENNVGYRGENIAAGYTSADDVMDGWMNSEGHRANILSENFGKLGVGYAYDSSTDYKNYWVQMFRSNENSGEVVSTDDILTTKMYTSSKSSVTTPDGIEQNGSSLVIDDDYSGGVWLYGWDFFNNQSAYGDSEIKDIYDFGDTVSNRVLTGNDQDNWIWASDNGNQMWGGFNGTDYLWGGAGADTYWFGVNEGTTYMMDVNSNDIVNLWNINLGEFSFNIDDTNKIISIDANSGGHGEIHSVSDTVQVNVADGSSWQYNYNTKELKAL